MSKAEKERSHIRISGIAGNVIGVDVSGSGNIIGKNIAVDRVQYTPLKNSFQNLLNLNMQKLF
jgi:hypothetical protein